MYREQSLDNRSRQERPISRARPESPRNLLAVIALTCAAAAVAACGSTAQVVELEPMKLAAVEIEGQQRAEVLDPELLFREGGRAFEKQDYATAAARYSLVVEHFPDSRYANVSAFNGGLSFERNSHFEDAIPLYAKVAEALKGSKDGNDALFRMAACYGGLQRWEDAIGVYERILTPEFPEMHPVDKLEAYARRGEARHELGELALAERDYKAALKIFRKHIGSRALAGNEYISMAQYRIGEIYRELFGSIRFRLPVESMARDLEDKSNYFLKAQNAYLKALRMHHPKYATAAGYRLGSIYEQFYDDMMSAEVPDDLSDYEVEVYFDELKRKIRPLIVRAIGIYERNIRLSQRFGQDGSWAQKSKASLARLKDILRQDEARKVEAALDNAVKSESPEAPEGGQ